MPLFIVEDSCILAILSLIDILHSDRTNYIPLSQAHINYLCVYKNKQVSALAEFIE